MECTIDSQPLRYHVSEQDRPDGTAQSRARPDTGRLVEMDGLEDPRLLADNGLTDAEAEVVVEFYHADLRERFAVDCGHVRFDGYANQFRSG